MEYAKIKQERLADVIARQLEKLILEGVLNPGERLPPERELSRELDVSRPSLREALQKLEASGLLETRHGGGTYVRNTIAEAVTEPLIDVFQRHPEAALDFIELRGTLEGMSAYTPPSAAPRRIGKSCATGFGRWRKPITSTIPRRRRSAMPTFTSPSPRLRTTSCCCTSSAQ